MYKNQRSYESPTRNCKTKPKTTITLEENYSQTKNYHKGKLVSSHNANKVHDISRPIPNKSLTTSSNNDSSQEVHEKAVIYNYDTNPFQASNKPTSVKVEQ